MDTGVIDAFKKRYRSFHLAHAIDRDAAGEKDLYKVEILKAMRWFRASGNALTSETIANCWRHTGFLDGGATFSRPNVIEVNAIDQLLLDQVKQLNISSPLSFDDMEEHEAEAVIHHAFSDIDLVELFSEDAGQNIGEDAEVPENTLQELSIEDNINALKLTLNLLVDELSENESAIWVVRNILYHLSKEKAETTIIQSQTERFSLFFVEINFVGIQEIRKTASNFLLIINGS